jgi:hypothetical protein
MAKGLLDLAKNMDALAARLKEESSRAAVKTAETILYDLAFVTPVDTSQALSNWQVSLKSKIALGAKIDPYYPGLGGSTQHASALAAIEAGKNMLRKKKPGDKIFISNVLPYINRLNEGYSKQEPAGFVQRATIIGRDVVKKFKLKLKG